MAEAPNARTFPALTRLWRVKAVNDIQVQVVRSQAPERTVDLPQDRGPGEVAFVKVHLGGQNHLIPGNIVLEGPSKVLLTGPRRIGVCSVKKIDAEFQGMPDDLFAFLRVQRPCVHLACGVSEAHAADAET